MLNNFLKISALETCTIAGRWPNWRQKIRVKFLKRGTVSERKCWLIKESIY